MEESIYDLIQQTKGSKSLQPIYRSKYPHDIPPTASTFCHQTTSRPGISNISGSFSFQFSPHKPNGATQTFGKLKESTKKSPQNYQKKQTGTMGNSSLPPVNKFSYDCSFKREPVPKVTEFPMVERKAQRNFILENAISNIISSKKMPEQQQVNWLRKKDYGTKPLYLARIKKSIRQEYMKYQNEPTKQNKQRLMEKEEVEELKEGLKRKWEEVNRKYQKLTYLQIVDTTGLKRKKLDCEREMQEIQQYIRVLNKQYIFIQG